MRLDLYLSQNFDIQSRNKALELILSNKVRVDGKIVSKASFLVDEKMKIELLEEDFYDDDEGPYAGIESQEFEDQEQGSTEPYARAQGPISLSGQGLRSAAGAPAGRHLLRY